MECTKMAKTIAGTMAASLVALGLLGCEQQTGADAADTRSTAATDDTTADTAAAADAAAGGTADAAGAGAAAAGTTVRLADIAADPAAYEGKSVTIEADVEEVLAPYAFALDEDAPLAGGVDNDVLVFSRKSANLASIDDQWLDNRVRVTGVVHTMAVVDVEREIGWDLDPQVEVELEGREPVIMATAVERLAETRTASP